MGVFALATLGACSAPADSMLDPAAAWAGEIENLRAMAKGTMHEAFTLQVLEDRVISDEEAAQAAARYEQCMHDRGYDTYSFDPLSHDFGSLLEPDRWDDEAVDADTIDCDKQTNGTMLASMWLDMTTTPSILTPTRSLSPV